MVLTSNKCKFPVHHSTQFLCQQVLVLKTIIAESSSGCSVSWRIIVIVRLKINLNSFRLDRNQPALLCSLNWRPWNCIFQLWDFLLQLLDTGKHCYVDGWYVNMVTMILSFQLLPCHFQKQGLGWIWLQQHNATILSWSCSHKASSVALDKDNTSWVCWFTEWTPRWSVSADHRSDRSLGAAIPTIHRGKFTKGAGALRSIVNGC